MSISDCVLFKCCGFALFCAQPPSLDDLPLDVLLARGKAARRARRLSRQQSDKSRRPSQATSPSSGQTSWSIDAKVSTGQVSASTKESSVESSTVSFGTDARSSAHGVDPRSEPDGTGENTANSLDEQLRTVLSADHPSQLSSQKNDDQHKRRRSSRRSRRAKRAARAMDKTGGVETPIVRLDEAAEADLQPLVPLVAKRRVGPRPQERLKQIVDDDGSDGDPSRGVATNAAGARTNGDRNKLFKDIDV